MPPTGIDRHLMPGIIHRRHFAGYRGGRLNSDTHNNIPAVGNPTLYTSGIISDRANTPIFINSKEVSHLTPAMRHPLETHPELNPFHSAYRKHCTTQHLMQLAEHRLTNTGIQTGYDALCHTTHTVGIQTGIHNNPLQLFCRGIVNPSHPANPRRHRHPFLLKQLTCKSPGNNTAYGLAP